MAFFNRAGSVETSALAELALFRGLHQPDLEAIAKVATRREIPAGETFIEQGRVGLESYAIAEGTANVYMNGQYVTSVSTGCMVGEMALLGSRPRNATLIAETDMVVVSFKATDLNTAFEESSELKTRVTALLERRLNENSG